MVPTFVVLWNEEALSSLQLQPEDVFCMLCMWGYISVINYFLKRKTEGLSASRKMDVISRIMAPQRYPYSNNGTCEYITLCDKRDLGM